MHCMLRVVYRKTTRRAPCPTDSTVLSNGDKFLSLKPLKLSNSELRKIITSIQTPGTWTIVAQ